MFTAQIFAAKSNESKCQWEIWRTDGETVSAGKRGKWLGGQMRVKILKLKFLEGNIQESQVKRDKNDVTTQQLFKFMSGVGGEKINQYLHLF